MASDDEVVVLLRVEAGQIGREERGFGAGSASDGRVGGLLISGDFRLGGDVILKVGPNGLLIVELIDDFPCLFDGLDDELDLVVEVVDLLYLDLEHVVFEDLLAALGVLANALLQLHQLQLRLHEPLDPDWVVLEARQLQLQLLVLLAQEDHLLGEGHVLFHFVVDADVELFVLPAVDAVVLDQHEHVPPPVLLVLLQLLILGLDALELVYVLALHPHRVVLELIADFSVGVFEGVPVGVESAHQVFEDHL